MIQSARIRVKFLTKLDSRIDPSAEWLHYFPNRQPTWGNCDYIFDPQCRDYDWLVVYDDLPSKSAGSPEEWQESLACNPENTLLITGEPSSIKSYGQGFLRQFHWLLTSQEPWAARHPNRIFRQPGLIWFYGNPDDRGSYNSLISRDLPQKTATISTVCSSKQMRHTLHQNRYDFTQILKKYVPELEIFGHGVRSIDNKADALDSFRYHLTIENHISPHHWTEKIADAFLGFTLPFYYGCPNIFDYFPEDSLIPIDIHQVSNSIETIQKAIRDDEFSRRLPAIREARHRYLTKFTTFAQLTQLIEANHQAKSPHPQRDHVIQTRHLWRKKHPIAAIFHGIEKATIQTLNRVQYKEIREK